MGICIQIFLAKNCRRPIFAVPESKTRIGSSPDFIGMKEFEIKRIGSSVG